MKKLFIFLAILISLLVGTISVKAQLTPQQIDKFIGTATGTDSYSVTITAPNMPTAPYNGQTIKVKNSNTNTGASTLKVNSYSAKAITLNNSAVASGDFPANTYIIFVFDASTDSWQMSKPGPSSSVTGDFWNEAGNVLGADTKFLGSTDNFDVLFKSNNTERMRLLKGGNFGIGTSAPSSLFHVVQTISGTPVVATTITARHDLNLNSSLDASSDICANMSALTITGSSNYSKIPTAGCFSFIHNGTGNLTDASFGVSNIFTNGNTGTIANGAAVFALTENTAGGIITNAIGVAGTVNNTGAGSMTHASSFYAFPPDANVGTVTNRYGLRVADMTGLGTNHYNIYSEGTSSNNVFQGKVGIGTGTVVPSVLLDLGLAGTTKGVMRFAGNTSGNVSIMPLAAAGTYTITLPPDDGTASQFLQTDGTGITSWQTVSTALTVSTTAIASGTVGAVLFEGVGNVLQEDATNYFWDNSNNYLGIGTNAPAKRVHILGATNALGYLRVEQSGTTQEATLECYSDNASSASIRQMGSAVATAAQYPWLIPDAGVFFSSGAGGAWLVNSGNGGIHFATGNGAATPERMAISTTGYVSIGTITPVSGTTLLLLGTTATSGGSALTAINSNSVTILDARNDGAIATTYSINATAGDAITIDKAAGSFVKDATGTTFTLTNALITANSQILWSCNTTGITTGYDIAVVPGAGSAVFTFQTAGVGAAPNANMTISFLVLNY